MRFTRPALRHALLAWASISIGLGLAGDYGKSSTPLLERHRWRRPNEVVDTTGRVRSARDRAATKRNDARQRAQAAALGDSVASSTAPLQVDVRLPDATRSAAIEEVVRGFWKANASSPTALRTIVTVRDASDEGTWNRVVSLTPGQCRMTIFIREYPAAGQWALDSWQLRRLGVCLFAARYGTPGTGMNHLIASLDAQSLTPCFIGRSQVAQYRCRRSAAGPKLGSSRKVMDYGYEQRGGAAQLACGANRPGACERFWATAFPAKQPVFDLFLLPFLELDLRPKAFGRVWSDARPVDSAYTAVSGRPFSSFLSGIAVSPSAEYSPAPTLRPRELLASLAIIAMFALAGVLGFHRRTAFGDG